MYTLEVIASTPKDIIISQQNGAHRVELVSGLSEGGLTPSIGLLEQAKKVAKIPIMVMIRPRGGDFSYDEVDIHVMEKDIKIVKELGLAGIVFGALDEHNELNFQAIKNLMKLADGLDITFHRAFDATNDIYCTAVKLNELGIKRILTSGQAENSFLGITKLVELQDKFLNDLTFMPGVGITPYNIAEFLKETPITKEVHLGLGVRANKDPLSAVQGELVSMTRQILNELAK